MLLCQSLHNRQPDAQAFVLTVQISIDLNEARQRFRNVVFRYADATVADTDIKSFSAG